MPAASTEVSTCPPICYVDTYAPIPPGAWKGEFASRLRAIDRRPKRRSGRLSAPQRGKALALDAGGIEIRGRQPCLERCLGTRPIVVDERVPSGVATAAPDDHVLAEYAPYSRSSRVAKTSLHTGTLPESVTSLASFSRRGGREHNRLGVPPTSP